MLRSQAFRFHGFDEFLALSAAHEAAEYSVGWMDSTATGGNFARGIFLAGDHSDQPASLESPRHSSLSIPFNFPRGTLNRLSVGAFNSLYYRLLARKQSAHPVQLRFVLLSAGPSSALESSLRQARHGAVPMCFAPDSGPAGAVAIDESSCHCGLVFFSGSAQRLWRIGVTRYLVVSNAGDQPGARLPNSWGRHIRSDGQTGAHNGRTWWSTVSGEGCANDSAAIPGLLSSVAAVRSVR